MKPVEKVLFLLIFGLVIFGVFLSRTNLAYFEGSYVREDGLIEWLTVLALLLGAFVCFYRSRILLPFRGGLFSTMLVLLGLVFVFGAGEEISWGQRILGIESSPFFMANNSQMEMNLHNLMIGGKSINRLVFGTLLGIGIAIYFLILPVLYRKKESIKKLADRFAVPIPKLFHIGAYLLLFGLVQLVEGGKKGELLEFGGCWIVFLMIFAPYNRCVFSRRSFER